MSAVGDLPLSEEELLADARDDALMAAAVLRESRER